MLNIDFLKQNNIDSESYKNIDIYNKKCHTFLSDVEDLLKNIELNNNLNIEIIKTNASDLGFNDIEKLCEELEKDFNKEKSELLINKVKDMIKILNEYLEIKEDVLLIADDSKLVTNFISKVLKDKYNTISANDGEETIEIINNPKYNVIALLLDLTMPILNGLDVLKYLNDNNLLNKIPVSIITDDDSKDLIKEAYNYEICEILIKPFNKKSVIKVSDKTVNFYKHK